MRTTFKKATAAIALSLGIVGATLPLAAEAKPAPTQCTTVTNCGSVLDYILSLLKLEAAA